MRSRENNKPSSNTTLLPRLPVDAPKIVTFNGAWDILPPRPRVPGMTSEVMERYCSLEIAHNVQRVSGRWVYLRVG